MKFDFYSDYITNSEEEDEPNTEEQSSSCVLKPLR